MLQLLVMSQPPSGVPPHSIKKLPKLTSRQELFVKHYVAGNMSHPSHAARLAGYRGKNVDVTAQDVLGSPSVRAAIEEEKAKLARKVEVTAEYVLGNLIEVAERCMQKTPVLEYDRDAKAYKEVGVWEFDSGGATKALELLGKYLALFTEKHQIEGLNAQQIDVVMVALMSAVKKAVEPALWPRISQELEAAASVIELTKAA